MSNIKINRALIAVYDKTGIADFARVLVNEFGIEIISTGGTAKHLKDAGIPVTMVEQVTGFPEMLDGRVKTLHPKVHAGILADRDKPEHMKQLAEHGIKPIDMVVVNLYPFEETVSDPDCRFEDAIEMIDIGGPCMLRAAAKNHKHVVVLTDLDDGEEVCDQLRRTKGVSPEKRRELAMHVFNATCDYDTHVAEYLQEQLDQTSDSEDSGEAITAPWFSSETHTLFKQFDRFASARYGENPSQAASVWLTDESEEPIAESNLLVRSCSHDDGHPALIHGEMSFNNYVDGDSALSLVKELTRAGSALWHRRPAGVSCGTGVSPVHQRKNVIAQEMVSRRNLPHIQNPGSTYFVTFRVKQGELPPEARTIVLDACKHWHEKKMTLHIAVVMPDHVHLLMTPYTYDQQAAVALGEILHSIKSYTSHEINKKLGRTGPLWLDESFDRVMRNEKEFVEKWEYIETNPDRAKIGGADYPWVWTSGIGFVRAGEVKEEQAEKHRRDAGATTVYAVAFIKHTNACGCAIGDDPIDAYRRAYLGDPIAAAGGVLCMNFPVTRDIADTVMNSFSKWGKAAGAAFFKLDVWIAPGFDEDAIELITTPTEKRKWGKECRLLAVGPMDEPPNPNDLDFKKITGGMLVQRRDLIGLNEQQWKVVTKRQPTDREMADLRFAWLVCKHTKSNAITICKDGTLLGNGAGQMSRVKSCDLAIQLSRENGHGDSLAGAVAAGDAFFPVEDGPKKLIAAGITAIIQPGGSTRDPDTLKAADEANVAMIITGTRHFKH